MHLKDIMATAVPDVDRNTPLNVQLDKAEGFINSARASVEFKRPDLAYKEYLKGYELAVNYIPRHKDYGFFCDTNKKWEARHRSLLERVRHMEGMMEDIRRVIEDDNRRSGVQSQYPTPLSQNGHRYSQGYEIQSNGVVNGSQRHYQSLVSSGQRQAQSRPSSSQSDRERPTIRPKPDSMHVNKINTPASDLTERFSRLRGPSHGLGESASASLTMPSTAESTDGARPRPQSYSPQSSSQNSGTSSDRLAGPRDMPIPLKVPSLPPKIPLMAVTSMPKPPSPTYSPAKVATVPPLPNPPRSSVETSLLNPEKRQTYYTQSIGTSQPSTFRRTQEESPYRPTTPNGINSAIIAKSRSSDIPNDPAISAQTLVEYMRRFNVLLIDVRDRQSFDEGHILAQSILCIEPIGLKEGVSAEELEERLVLSPESEQSLFERRNEFDIVVYYDQSTASTRYLAGPPTGSSTPALRALYDTLYEFNDYKPLRDGRPPALLVGGIEAWIDLMGTNSLMVSKTAALTGSTRRRPVSQRPGRPLARHRVASLNSSLEVRKRRLREHKPLHPDEEEAWRQKAHDEEVITVEYDSDTSDGDQGGTDELEPNSPFVHDYESFLRKFPEVNGVQQSMTVASRRPLPPLTRRYDPPPVPSALSRPLPAVPRPSYSGQADMNQSQVPLARQTSAMRPPLYASSSVMRRMKLPRTGLTNFGVTCYTNATLQCLSATIPLSQFFLEDRYRSFVQKNWKGSTGIMPDLYANLIRSLWKSDVEVIKPTTFRNFCGRMNREWVIDRQQDAKEFFDFLVDCLHEDLNMNWERTPLKPLNFAEEVQRERTAIARASSIEWDRFQHRDYSYVSSLFAGQHASRLRCTTCRNTSTTYEAFYSISVEIPQSGQGNVYDCLRSYCQEEVLSGDEVWKCPYCKCEREATKQILLTRLPQFLVVHFKRFSASKMQSARKIHTPIEFPLYGLNMDHFMIPRTTAVADGSDQKIDAAVTSPFTYDAYGVLRHLGSSGNGGHYIALVKDPGRGVWRKFDDERSYDFDPSKMNARDRLTNGEAYIVFFQRAAAR